MKTYPLIALMAFFPFAVHGTFEVSGEVMVWTTREAGTDCWAEVITTQGFNLLNDLREVHFDWDAGFRVGVGYFDQWDTQLLYTRFYTLGKDQVLSEPGTVHSTFTGNFYIDNPTGSGISGPAYDAANIHWTIDFNIFDWELGHKFCPSRSLVLRPYLGIKGGRIDQTIRSQWINASFVGNENLKNHFWGIGPQLGISTDWKLLDSFSLISDFTGALMWGHWSLGDHFSNSVGQQVAINLHTITSGATMVRGYLGFQWEVCHFTAKLGYEMQVWLDQLQFYSFTGGRLDNALTLQGGTFEICFSF